MLLWPPCCGHIIPVVIKRFCILKPFSYGVCSAASRLRSTPPVWVWYALLLLCCCSAAALCCCSAAALLLLCCCSAAALLLLFPHDAQPHKPCWTCWRGRTTIQSVMPLIYIYINTLNEIAISECHSQFAISLDLDLSYNCRALLAVYSDPL